MTATDPAAPQLDLFRCRGPWPGAGRPPGPNPRVPHESRPDFPGRFPAHVTLKVVRGLRTLRDLRIVRALEATLAAACERGDFRVTQYTIQADHLHLLVESDDRHALGRGMKSISARVARAVNAPCAARAASFAIATTCGCSRRRSRSGTPWPM